MISHLICIADDCLAANCEEGAKAAAEAAIMAPRARENFIFFGRVDGKKCRWRVARKLGYELIATLNLLGASFESSESS